MLPRPLFFVVADRCLLFLVCFVFLVFLRFLLWFVLMIDDENVQHLVRVSINVSKRRTQEQM